MKRSFAYVAAIFICALMLTACGRKISGDDILIDNIPAAEITGNNDILSEDISDAEDTEINDPDNDETTVTKTGAEPIDTSVFYASIEDFAAADDIFEHPAEALDDEDSYTSAFMKKLEFGNDLYISLDCFESINDIPDGGVKLSMATTGDKLFLHTAHSEENVPIIIKDGMSYLVNDDLRSAAYVELSEQGLRMSIEQISEEFLSILNIENEVFYGSGTMSYTADIGGDIYTLEFNGYIGMLYDQEGTLCLKINKKTDAVYYAVRVNEFSEYVPESIFDIPSDYEIISFLGE